MSEQIARLITEDIPGFFFRRSAAIGPLVRLTLVSPWVSLQAGEAATLSEILTKAQGDSSAVVLVTRPPQREDAWHLKALEAIANLARSRAYLHPTLHAKFFIAESRSSAMAVLGSANLTARGSIGREAGVFIVSQGWGARMISELLVLSGRLCHDVGASRFAREA
jgi:phosphatidylserine/phosphatidylglycerophosphate/cardiolipin synthase-like enzyme